MNQEIMSKIEQIQSHEDFCEFLVDLKKQAKNPAWKNRELPGYLDAMAAWASDMDGYFQNQGQECPTQPSWKLVAQLLVAAAIYE